MSWMPDYSKNAEDDLKDLDNSQRIQVLKSVTKALLNPLPQNEGGYGHPLGNKRGNNLTGCFKLKLKKLGLRIVYQLNREQNIMKIIAISARDDEEVYNIVSSRLKNM
jgi:mRNA interferase RelE/StbE